MNHFFGKNKTAQNKKRRQWTPFKIYGQDFMIFISSAPTQYNNMSTGEYCYHGSNILTVTTYFLV